MLYGRDKETAAIDALIARSREGHGGALVLRGEAGIGKTALLDHAEQAADGMRVIRGVGIESESELAFAGLHLLLGPYMDRADALPAPQAAALRGAFGLSDSGAADRFMMGIAVLSMLDEIATERPLLLILDDAQWLDRSSLITVLFAARRLEADRIGVVVAVRDGYYFPDSALPELRLPPVDREAAGRMLAEFAPDLAANIRDHVIDQAQGNPLALRELPLTLSRSEREGELSSATRYAGSEPVTGRVEDAFARRIAALPVPTQRALLIVAAEESGDLKVVMRAGAPLGLGVHDLATAERARLIRTTGDRVDFVHPLIRSATYRRATVAQRVDAHRALADVSPSDRRAWHLAAAATETDEEVAGELENAAERARSHRGFAAVAAAYHRAAELTPDPYRRADRLAAGAEAAHHAGQPQLAKRLAEAAAQDAVSPLAKAQIAWVDIATAHERQEQMPSAEELLNAAGAIGDASPDMATAMILEAVAVVRAQRDPAATSRVLAQVDRISWSCQCLERVASALQNVASATSAGDTHILLDLMESVDVSQLNAYQRVNLLLCRYWTGDLDGALDDASALARDCRAEGAFGPLPRVLVHLTRAQILTGRLRDAATTAAEGRQLAESLAQPHYAAHLAALDSYIAAIEGDEQRWKSIYDSLRMDGLDGLAAEVRYAGDLIDLAAGRPDSVLERSGQFTSAPSRQLAVDYLLGLPGYAEAAARAGSPELAAEAVDQFHDYALATGRSWAIAIALRCKALLADPDEADDFYARAVQHHRRDDKPVDRARTELLYGQWLRRRLRRNDSRPLLRSAMETFERVGAAQWARIAAADLRAAGEATGRLADAVDHLASLTPQELQVCRLAAEGLSNREIGAKLFLSPRTVGYHLSKAYPKLGVASRNDLIRIGFD